MTQRFCSSAHADLGDFLTILKASSNNEALSAAIDETRLALKEATVINAVTNDYAERLEREKNSYEFRATGLAIFIPSKASELTEDYHDLAWARDSLWESMLLDYFSRSVATDIIRDLQKGNVTSLASFLSKAKQKNQRFVQMVLSRIRFFSLCEAYLPNHLHQQIQNMIFRARVDSREH